MNTHKLKLAALLFAFYALWTPQSSEAYFTTDQQAYKLTDSTALFSITYTFGFAERDLYMPIMATPINTERHDLILNYELLDDGETSTLGTKSSIVIAEGPGVAVTNGTYFIPAGTAAKLTLYTLVTLSEAEQNTNPDLSVHVTHLPFTMKFAGQTINAQLNPSELSHYQTPELDM